MTNKIQAIKFLCGPDQDHVSAQALAENQGLAEPILLQRRGYQVAWVVPQTTAVNQEIESQRLAWSQQQGLVLPAFFHDELNYYSESIDASLLMAFAIMDGEDPQSVFTTEVMLSRLGDDFEMLACSEEAVDEQQIVSIDFDAYAQGELIADDLWLRISWLSLFEEDSSLRFRFSFGLEFYEDVSLDVDKQRLAAQLCERIFPESALITQNTLLNEALRQLLQQDQLEFVERIVYLNSPKGGAQFHHDVERGHQGVVFAQLHGRTVWLVVPKLALVEQIQTYLAQQKAKSKSDSVLTSKEFESLLALDTESLGAELDSFSNNALEKLLNRSLGFNQMLLANGYGYLIAPGDIMLLPQAGEANCAWHSVFCADDYPGLALSFAIR